MYWTDEGYLLSKNNFDENSIIIESFTLNHGKYTGIVYGGSSRKQKRNFQIGNKILLNWKSKSENKMVENFSSCLGALKLIQNGWETEAIPESMDKNSQKKGFLNRIFSNLK